MTFSWDRRPAGGAGAVIQRRVERAHRAALEDVARIAAAQAPRRTGEYAGSIHAYPGEGATGRVGSPLARAGAVERGANVGPRRGPHMRGQPSVRPAAIQNYRRAFASRMQSSEG